MPVPSNVPPSPQPRHPFHNYSTNLEYVVCRINSAPPPSPPPHSMASRQALADALALLVCAHEALVMAGGMATLTALVGLPSYALGLGAGALSLSLSMLAAAAAARALTRGRDAAARQEELLARVGREMLLVPETLARWCLYGRAPVELYEAANGAKLLISSLPSPHLLRSLARVHRRSRRVVVINACRSWSGWDQLCEELGLDLLNMHT